MAQSNGRGLAAGPTIHSLDACGQLQKTTQVLVNRGMRARKTRSRRMSPPPEL
jgi:hypothetical protein